MLYNVILSFEAALIVDIFPAGTSTDLILTVMTHRGSVDGKHSKFAEDCGAAA